MSSQFRGAAVATIVWLSAGCASVAPHGAPGVPATAPAATLTDVVADAQSLDQPSNAARVDAVQALLRRRKLPFSLQPVPNAARQRDPREQGQNIVIDIPGSIAGEIVVGAHLDAVPLSGGGQSRGMVDNGAGVAVLTRVAEALLAKPLRHRVRVVFFDLEENGLQGSRHFVSTVDKTRVQAMVNIDIAAYGDTVMSGPTAGAGTAPLHQALARVCAARHYECLRFPAFPGSDDRSFQAAGIPSISMAVLPALEAHQVWVLLNGGKESGFAAGFAPPILQTIHTPQDTASKLSPDGMTLIFNAVLGLLLELDRGEPAPASSR